MGGLQLVISDLNSTDHEVQNEAALVLSSAVQRLASLPCSTLIYYFQIIVLQKIKFYDY